MILSQSPYYELHNPVWVHPCIPGAHSSLRQVFAADAGLSGASGAPYFVSQLFDPAGMVFILPAVISGIFVIIDTDQEQIALIMRQPFRVVLPPDLIHSCLHRMIVFQFNQQCGFVRIIM